MTDPFPRPGAMARLSGTRSSDANGIHSEVD